MSREKSCDIVDIIWQQGFGVAGNWLNGTFWYQIVLKNIVVTLISTDLGTFILSIISVWYGGRNNYCFYCFVVGLLWNSGISGINSKK